MAMMTVMTYFTRNRWTAMGMYRHLDKMMEVLGFFSRREWKFSNANQKIVANSMSAQDLQVSHYLSLF